MDNEDIAIYELIFHNRDGFIDDITITDDSLIKRTITNSITEKYPNWCLLIMLKDLLPPMPNNSDTINNSIPIIVDNTDTIIPLKMYDLIMKCLQSNNIWDSELDLIYLLMHQGIITSLALSTFEHLMKKAIENPISLMTLTDIEELIFVNEIAEFETSSCVNHVEYNNINHYIKAYKYLCNNPKVYYYQVISYNAGDVVILVNSVPLMIFNHNYKYKFEESTYIERQILINNTSVPLNGNVKVYIDRLTPDAIQKFACRSFTDRASRNRIIRSGNRDYYPHKLADNRELMDIAIKNSVIPSRPAIKEFIQHNEPEDIPHDSNYFIKVNFELSNPKYSSRGVYYDEYPRLLDTEAQNKICDTLYKIYEHNVSLPVVEIDNMSAQNNFYSQYSRTVIKVHCGYVKA